MPRPLSILLNEFLELSNYFLDIEVIIGDEMASKSLSRLQEFERPTEDG